MKRVGLLGGSFNPVHKDHLNLGCYVKEKLNLDEILLIPNAAPPHKNTCHVSYADRVSMLQLACKGHNSFKISNIEADSSVPHYSFDTLRALYNENPHTAFFFIMGLDSLLYLDKWHEGLKLINYANLAVMCRKGYENQAITPKIANFLKNCAVYDNNTSEFSAAAASRKGHCLMLSSSLNEVSSSAIRNDIECYYQTSNPKYLIEPKNRLEPEVLEYILGHKLYNDNVIMNPSQKTEK